MNLDLSVDVDFRVTMTDYLKKIVSDFPDTIQGIVATPAVENMFTVR